MTVLNGVTSSRLDHELRQLLILAATTAKCWPLAACHAYHRSSLSKSLLLLTLTPLQTALAAGSNQHPKQGNTSTLEIEGEIMTNSVPNIETVTAMGQSIQAGNFSPKG